MITLFSKPSTSFSLFLLLPLLVFIFFCETVGVFFEKSFLFALKVLFCDIIPGLFLVHWFRPDIRSPLVATLYAPALGMILEISIYLIFSILKLHPYFFMYYSLPIAFVLLGGRSFLKKPWNVEENLPSFMGYAGLVFFVLVACTIPTFQSGLRPGINDDLLFQVIVTKSLQQGYPFEYLLSEGCPWYYHYCYHVFVDASHQLAGTSTFLTTIRLAPVFCFLSLFFMVLGFCHNNFKKYPTLLSSLLIIQLFAVVGFQSEIVGKIFGGALSAPMARMHSNILGFTFTLLITDFIFHYLKAPDHIQRNKLYLIVILAIAFITAGTRSAAMFFVVGGLGLLFTVSLLHKNWEDVKRTIFVGIPIGFGFCGALLFFYGIHTKESASNFQSYQGISGQIDYIMNVVPFGYSLTWLSQYIPEYATGLIIILVMFVFRAGFLSLPYLLNVSSILVSRFQTSSDNIYYLGGLTLTAIMWALFMVQGGSQYAYLFYTGLGASLLAASYLSSFNLDAKLSKIIVLITGVLFLVHICEVFYKLYSYRFLIERRYQTKVVNYTDLVGRGFERILMYLKRNAKDGVVAFSWHHPPPTQPLLIHILVAETGLPVLNDSKYMNPTTLVSSDSRLYPILMNRLRASQNFDLMPEKSIFELYKSIQNKARPMYLISDRELSSTKNMTLQFIMEDIFQQNRYILYKVKVNPFARF